MAGPSRLGQDLGAGAEFANFLKIFGAEVLGSFKRENLFMNLTKVQTISDGKSATFPVIGRATAKYHTAGDDVLVDTPAAGGTYTSNILGTEKEIFVDSPLVSPVLVSDIDRLMTHFEYRSEYASEIAHSLSDQADTNILSTIYAAALAPESIAGQTGRPTVAFNAGFATSAATLRQGIFDAKVAMDNAKIPAGDRYVALRPDLYAMLAADPAGIDQDAKSFGLDPGKGQILRVAGMTLVQTTGMPTTDLSLVAAPGVNNDVFGAAGIGYNGPWQKVAALCFHPSSAGTVKLSEISIESERITQRLSDLMLGSFIMGHNVLRPESAVVLKTVA